VYKTKSLKKAANYSKRRISKADVSLDNFITTDNLLPGKTGVGSAVNLPPQDGAMPSYEEGDILVSNIRPYLKKIWLANRSGGCSADVLVFDVDDSHHPSFIYYAMFQDIFFDHMMRGSKGTKMPRGDKTQVMDFKIPDIDIENQKKIAAVLSALDEKIELNNRINAELEAMAKTLYDYWFVQFDFPFDFAQGRPDANGRPYKSSGGKMVYNPALKRHIPEGWDVPTIGKIFNTSLGGTPSRNKKEYWEPAEINWLSSGEKVDLFVVEADEKISRKGLKNSAAKELPAGTVILSIVRHLRASILGVDAATNQSVAGIEETESIKHCFIFPLIEREIPRYMTVRTGAQQPHINKDAVDTTSFVLPPAPVLRKYTEIAMPIFKQIQNNQFQTQHPASLRDFLLPMLMNGQVQVG
jgi:type I restriction enzyme, S subunit